MTNEKFCYGVMNACAAVCTVLIVFVAYVLSYAPIVRWQYGADSTWSCGGGDTEDPDFGTLNYTICQGPPTRVDTGGAYKPVEWLIDRTDCRPWLQRWSDTWDVTLKTNPDVWVIPFNDDDETGFSNR